MAMTRDDWKESQLSSRDWLRVAWPGLATFFLPIAGVVAVTVALFLLLPPEWFDTRNLHFVDIASSKIENFGADIDGRMTFSIMSVAVWIAGSISIVLSCVVMGRTLGIRAVRYILPAALVIGLLIGYKVSYSGSASCNEFSGPRSPSTIPIRLFHGFRFVVIDYVMCVSDLHRTPDMQVRKTTENMILANSLIGIGGAAALMAAFGALAVRPSNRQIVWRLRRRLDDFRTLTLMASVLFVLEGLITKALISWTEQMLKPPDADNFKPLGNALLNYWAAQASTVLFIAIGCAALAIYSEINKAAAIQAPIERSEQAKEGVKDADKLTEAKWKEAHGLTFETTTVVTATVGTIAPFLAGPAADLLARAVH